MSEIYTSVFEAGEYLFHQGEVGDKAYIIDTGQIEIQIDGADQGLAIARLGPGDLVGEMAIIDDMPRSASAQAIERTEVLVISSDHVKQKIDSSDPIIRFFLSIVMERYRDLHARLMQVIEGVNPQAEPAQDFGSSTVNATNILVSQYRDMQNRVLSAVNTTNQYDSRQSRSKDLASAREALDLERGLNQALENQEFVLHYQPIVDLSSKKITGCEALIRWQHPVGGLISPIDFIPQAEQSGLIIPIGDWLAQTACDFQAQVSGTRASDFSVNINLSCKQFEDRGFIHRLGNLVTQRVTRPECIKFEITESLLMMNPDLAERSLNELKDYGLQLAIDDFGTGYSSLSYLHRFPFDSLKIDRSFVGAMVEDKKSNEIVKSLIGLAHNLNMSVVAEGVENDFQHELVGGYGCEYAQGHWFSRAIPEQEFIQLLDGEG